MNTVAHDIFLVVPKEFNFFLSTRHLYSHSEFIQ